MKQTVNVNIAGIAFTLDRECYVMLNTFLDHTRLAVITHADRDQIMAEIEARIAEEILSAQTALQTVSKNTIRPIIERMGGESFDTSQQSSPSGDASQANATLQKRLFRNPNRSIFGGVCGGLASYFNIDVVLLRIMFLIPFFIMLTVSLCNLFVLRQVFSSLNVTSIIVYLILWIVIPKARTPREKLEMTGEPITVDTISSHPDSSATAPARRSSSVMSVILKVIAIAFGLSLLISVIVLSSILLFQISIKMSQCANPVYDILNLLHLGMMSASIWAIAIVLTPFFAIFYMILGLCLSWRKVGLVVGLIFLSWFIVTISALILVAVNMPDIATIIKLY